MAVRKPTNEVSLLAEANRLLIEYMGDQHELAFTNVQHKWGRIMALELNEHLSAANLSADDAFTLFKVVETIRDHLSRNFLVLENR